MKKHYNLKNMKAKSFFTCMALVLCLGLNAQSAEFTNFSLNYFQNFNGLNNVLNTNGIPWTNGSDPLVGWYGYKNMETAPDPSTSYGTGCDNEGAGTLDFPAANSLNSLGYNPDGLATATDRALGWRLAVAAGEAIMALNITNNTAIPILALKVTYTGEQWASVGGDDQKLAFSYQVGATTPADATGWTSVTQLDFTSPQNSGTPGSSSTVRIDGNLPENKTVGINHSFNVTIPVGATITLRWYKNDTGESDHILALDDLTVSALFSELSVADFEKDSVKFIVNSDNLDIISSKTQLSNISLYAITGALVKEENLSNSTEVNVSINKLQSGIYIAKVTGINGETIVKKFVK